MRARNSDTRSKPPTSMTGRIYSTPTSTRAEKPRGWGVYDVERRSLEGVRVTAGEKEGRRFDIDSDADPCDARARAG